MENMHCAAQGLVNAALSNGTLMTADGNSAEPHFDEAFLLGKNSKNAVLGEVYHNVSFPFKKKEDRRNGVEYWWFDSSKTTLAMQKDSCHRGILPEEYREPGLGQKCKQ